MTIYFADVLDRFERYMESSTRLSASSRQRYAYETRMFLETPYLSHLDGVKRLEDLNPRVLTEWNNQMHTRGFKPSTIALRHASLRRFLGYLDEVEEVLGAARLLQVLRRMGVPETQQSVKDVKVLNDDEAMRIILAAREDGNALGVRNQAMLHLLWDTGIRRHELVGLNLEGLDVTGQTITVVGKGNKKRVAFFADGCRDVVTEWLAVRSEWSPRVDNAFISVDGKALAPTRVNWVLAAAVERAGVTKKVWPHLFRHGRLTALLEGGMSLEDVAVFAGHADVRTTMGYYHPDVRRVKEAYLKTRKQPTE